MHREIFISFILQLTHSKSIVPTPLHIPTSKTAFGHGFTVRLNFYIHVVDDSRVDNVVIVTSLKCSTNHKTIQQQIRGFRGASHVR